MPDYRRNRVPGGTYFFTVNLANRRSGLLVREVETLRAAIRAVRLAAPFHIDAWVILPDHMHCIWTLPEEDTDYSGRWRAIKKRFSKALPNVELRRPEVLAREGRGIWQKRFWENTIRDDLDYRAHAEEGPRGSHRRRPGRAGAVAAGRGVKEGPRVEAHAQATRAEDGAVSAWLSDQAERAENCGLAIETRRIVHPCVPAQNSKCMS
jgi:putative transposase